MSDTKSGLDQIRIMSDKKVFVCSRAKALLRALIITIQPDMILYSWEDGEIEY